MIKCWQYKAIVSVCCDESLGQTELPEAAAINKRLIQNWFISAFVLVCFVVIIGASTYNADHSYISKQQLTALWFIYICITLSFYH